LHLPCTVAAASDMAPPPVTAVFILSLFMLPVSIWLAITLSIYTKVRPYFTQNWPSSPDAIRKRVLLSGDDDEAIFSAARVINASGSTVYVVKHERIPYLDFLRTSKAIKQYVGLASGRLTPILQRLKERAYAHAAALRLNAKISIPMNFPGTVLRLIESEKIDLWIRCNSAGPSIAHAQAKDVVLKHSAAKIFGPDVETTRLARSYAAFAHHLRHHENAIRCPKTAIVRSRAEIHELLWKAHKGQRFLLEKSAAPAQQIARANSGTKRDSGYDDSATLVDGSSDTEDFEGAETATQTEEYTFLPQATPNETYSIAASMKISQDSPWVMHEAIEGKPGTISTLVINGKIKAFAARTAVNDRTFSTASAKRAAASPTKTTLRAEHDIREWQYHEETIFIHPSSTLGVALLHFAQRFVATLSERPSTYLNLHFFLTDKATLDGAEQKIIATGCDFNFSSVLAQQALAHGLETQLGLALTDLANTEGDALLFPSPYSSPKPTTPKAYAHQSLLHALFIDVITTFTRFFDPVTHGEDPIFDPKDLVPWVWLSLVQRPVEIAFEGLVEIIEKAQATATAT
jgi:hypothetical protein